MDVALAVTTSHCQAKNSPGAPSIQCTHVDQPYQGQHGGNQFPYGGYPQQQPYQY